MTDSLPAIEATPVPAELAKAVQSSGLNADGMRSLSAAFAPHFQRFAELRETSKGIPVTAPKAARTLRLELKSIRVAAEKTRKELKEDSLRRGKAIDGINAVLEYELVPIEKAMDAIEKAEEIAEAARVAKLKAERAETLKPYADPTFYDLGNMPAAQWDQLLAGAKAAHEAKLAAARKAEEDRVAAELAAAEAKAKREAEEIAERERMRAENERLAKLAAQERAAREEQERKAAAEREHAQKEREAADRAAAKERAEIEAKAKAEREEADRIAQAERAKIEAQAAAEREQARKERAEAEAKAEAERAEARRLATIERTKREAAEAELQARNRAETARLEAEKIAAKKAAAAPDQEKICRLVDALNAVPLPVLASDSGKLLGKRITEQRQKFVEWLLIEAGRL